MANDTEGTTSVPTHLHLVDKANGRDQPTVFTFLAMTKGICTQSVRTVKARIQSRQLGICVTYKTIYIW